MELIPLCVPSFQSCNMWLLLDPEQNAADLLQLKPELVKELHQTETSATIAIVKARYVLKCNRERYGDRAFLRLFNSVRN